MKVKKRKQHLTVSNIFSCVFGLISKVEWNKQIYGNIFPIERFKCVGCPEDSDEGSIYPDCNCGKVGEYHKYYNKCTKCGNGSTGIFPNCLCNDENTVFSKNRNKCETCPPASSGKNPNCVCDNGGGERTTNAMENNLYFI